MNRLFLFPKRFILAIVVFGVIALLLSFFPFFSGMRFRLSFGAPWFFAVIFFLAFSTLKGFFMDIGDGIFGGTRFQPTAAMAKVLDITTDWVIYALTIFATAALMPDLASHSAALPIFVLSIIGGAGAACSDAIYLRVTTA